MIINITNLKKKILYRATYRGTKEMDKLLSSFTRKYINTLNEVDLYHLSDLLDLEDVDLYKFNQGKKLLFEIKKNKVTELFQNFIYKND
jgi:antitoxin CptB